MIERLQAKALRPGSSWVDWERIEIAYLGRARLSGQYDDYLSADSALEKAFERAGDERVGPFLARANLSFALHRFDRIEADLDRESAAVIVAEAKREAILELRADVLFHRGDYEGARRIYVERVERRPTLSALARLAQYHWKTGDLDEADRLLARALDLAGDDAGRDRAWVELQRGLIDLDRGRVADALDHYQVANAHFGGWYLIEEHIAEAEARLGRLATAESAYRVLVARTRNPEFMVALAGVLDEEGRSDDAKRWRAMALDGFDALVRKLPEASCGHALDFHLEHGAPETALDLAVKNYALRPNPEAGIALARAYVRAGDMNQARETIERCTASPHESAALHATAAVVYWKLGDSARATEEEKKALARNPQAMADVAWLKPARS
jgi:tetratricopeptide (TPR) repeat protein